MAKVKQVFKSQMPSCRFILKNGQEVHFNSSKFYTDDKVIISELEAEIAAGHPHIYRDPKELTIDTEIAELPEHLKEQAIKEFLDRQHAATSASNNRGNSEKERLTPANSNTIAKAASSSDSSGAKAVDLSSLTLGN